MDKLDWSERIQRTLNYLHEHLSKELDAVTLAQVAGFSPHHFHRVFRGMVGESVMEYTRRLRLEQAAMRLKHGQEPVLDVALGVGYQSHEGFTRAFTAHFGIAPTEFRRREQSLPAGIACSSLVQAPLRCLALWHIGPYADCGTAWGRLFGWAGQHRVALRPGHPPIGLCYDDPDITDPARCRYEACAVLAPGADPAPLPEGFHIREIPGGTYAQTLYTGPYDGISAAYAALLGQWLSRRSVTLPDEPTMEFYLNSPLDTPAAELQTEIRIRVEE
jgi:AraC family transcriptional regulator